MVLGTPSPYPFSDPQLLLTRAIRLIEAANIRPAHARPPHPTWSTAIMQIFRCYHPQGKQLFLKSCFPHLVTTADNRGGRDINVYGFSAGSYTGLAVHEILSEFAAFPGLMRLRRRQRCCDLPQANAESHWYTAWRTGYVCGDLLL